MQNQKSIPRYCLAFSCFSDNKDLRSFIPNLGKTETQVWRTSGCNEIQIHGHCDISASAVASELSQFPYINLDILLPCIKTRKLIMKDNFSFPKSSMSIEGNK